jgi:two-component system, NarL family, response regulator DevR
LKIRVLIVDDDVQWREGLRRLLDAEPDLAIAGTASNYGDAVSLARSCTPDIVLMDVNLSGMRYDGIDAMVEINRLGNVMCIMMTSLQDHAAVRDSFSAGALNYISKTCFESIPQAIREAIAGRASIHYSVADIMRGDYIRLNKKISDVEIELLWHLDKGHSVKEVADYVHMEEQSVKNALGRIAKKLGFKRFGSSVIERAKSLRWFS